MSPDSPPRRRRVQRVLVVERTERLTPHLVRVHLGGDDVAAFLAEADPDRLQATDRYVKMLFVPRGSTLTPPYDLDELRERMPRDQLPVQRTYTVRAVDAAAGTIAIDFVVHGEEGVAGPWAASARAGDLVALSGPGGGFAPASDPSVPRLLVGDDSAIPAIASALEALPAQATGDVLLEVESPDDELELQAPNGISVTWLHRDGREPGVALLEAVRALPRPAANVEVFCHGERGAMKKLRAVFTDEWQLDRRGLSLSAYWAFGRVEDDFQAEKREPIGQIFAEPAQ